MTANHFEKIAQELLKQKQMMDRLEAENHELRAQIADLRSGRGIFVDINGHRFALRDNVSPVQTIATPSVAASTPPSMTTMGTSTIPPGQQIVDAPTEAIPEIMAEQREPSVKAQVSAVNNGGDKNVTGGESTFLEEILVDEFANALTTPSAVWQDPTEKKSSNQQRKPHESIGEKQKETLRRELTGSYLLE